MSTADITIVCCAKPSCFAIAKDLKPKITGHTCSIVLPNSRKRLPYELIQDSLCIVLCTCTHIIKDLVKLVQNIHRLSYINSHDKILVLGFHRNKHLSKYRNLNWENIDACVSAIYEIISQNKHGIFQNLYEEYDEIGSVPSVYTSGHRRRTLHETELKCVSAACFAGEDACEDVKKSTVKPNVEPLSNIFINAQTLDPYEDNHGAYTLESCCKSKDTFGLSPVPLTEYFNQSSDEEQVGIRKYILTAVLPSLKEQHDFHCMCVFVGCKDYRIQFPVIETLNILLIESDFRKLHADIIYDGLGVCLDLLDRISSDQLLIKELCPVILKAFAILFLKTTNKEGGLKFQESLLQLATRYLHFTSDLKSLTHQNVITDDLLASLYRLLSTVISRIGQRSRLQMGNWKQALGVEENRENLRRNIKSMSYVEQYSCILGVINQLLQVDSSHSPDINGLLRNAIQILFDAAVGKKIKFDTTLYPILLLTTRGLCRFLQSKRLPGGSKKIFDILDIYLDNPKFCQIRRTSILGEMDNLLFLSDRSVVTKIIYLLRRNGVEAYDIRQKVEKHIENILQLTCFKITSQKHQLSTNLKPQWCHFDAKLCESRSVVLHALLPTLHCLTQGSSEDYKVKANQDETKLEINNLETLRHLQESSLHPNVIELLAYQVRPLPLFYVVDLAGDKCLHSFLIERRNKRQWLSPTELVPLVADCLSAIRYLHERKVIHRDITTHSFNIVENVNRRKVVLTSLDIARILDNNPRNDHSHVSDLSYNQIPVRWSAPESILDDMYDTKSDTYMFGHLLREIFTHGCQPFTELYNIPTEQVLTWVVFHNLPPRQWPCIPKKIHEISLNCVSPDPSDRLLLETIPAMLNDFMESACGTNNRRKTIRPFDEDKIHPRLSDLTNPERGLTPMFIGLKESNENPRKSYFNLKKSQRKVKMQMELNQADLLSPDQPSVKSGGVFLKVTEPVSKRYVETMLPKLNEHLQTELQIKGSIERVTGVHGSTEEIFLTLRYKCTNGMNVYDIASKHQFGNPSDKTNEIKYLSVVYGLAEYISKLHDLNYIHRDIQCKFLYYSWEKNKIICPRLGRMLFISHTSIDDSILEHVFEDNKNWMPIEVLYGGHYSQESDSYMFGMAIYEFYTALSIHNDNPMASDIECVPFCKVKREQLLEYLYGGERPYQPEHCPSWLYDIMTKCWDRDRTRRPSMKSILQEINKQLKGFQKNCTTSSSDDYPKSESELDTDEIGYSSSDDRNIHSNIPIVIPKSFTGRSGLGSYRSKSTVDMSPAGYSRSPVNFSEDSSESDTGRFSQNPSIKSESKPLRNKSSNDRGQYRPNAALSVPNASCFKQKSNKSEKRVTFNPVFLDDEFKEGLPRHSDEENTDKKNIIHEQRSRSVETIPVNLDENCSSHVPSQLQLHTHADVQNTGEHNFINKNIAHTDKIKTHTSTKTEDGLRKDTVFRKEDDTIGPKMKKDSIVCINDSSSYSEYEPVVPGAGTTLSVQSDSETFNLSHEPSSNPPESNGVASKSSGQGFDSKPAPCYPLTSTLNLERKPVSSSKDNICGNRRSSKIQCMNSSSSEDTDGNICQGRNMSSTSGISTGTTTRSSQGASPQITQNVISGYNSQNTHNISTCPRSPADTSTNRISCRQKTKLSFVNDTSTDSDQYALQKNERYEPSTCNKAASSAYALKYIELLGDDDDDNGDDDDDDEEEEEEEDQIDYEDVESTNYLTPIP